MATLKDIAKGAGVTVTTVSRVLNNRGYISDKTREKVYQVMEELNYRPNEIARSLARQKSNIIGLIIPTINHPFFSELAFYLEFFAYQRDYKIMLCNSQLESKKEKEYIDMLRAHQVDGLLLASHTLDIENYVNLELPIVTFDRKVGDIPFISSNNYQGGSLATNLLIDKDCQKIVYIGGNLKLNLLANRRYDAFLEIAEKRGIEHFIVQTELNGFNIKDYRRLILELLTNNPDIDGIFASSDLIAATVVKVALELGKNIPEDIKVIGYDDIPVASLFNPELTSIRQPIKEMGDLAIKILTKQIEGENVEKENILDVELIDRKST